MSGWNNFRNVTFGAAIFTGYDTPPGEELSATLRRWIDQFSDDKFAKHPSIKDGGNFWEIDYANAAQNIDLLTDRLAKVLLDLRSL